MKAFFDFRALFLLLSSCIICFLGGHLLWWEQFFIVGCLTSCLDTLLLPNISKWCANPKISWIIIKNPFNQLKMCSFLYLSQLVFRLQFVPGPQKTFFHTYSPDGRVQDAAFTALQAIFCMHIQFNDLRLVTTASWTREISGLESCYQWVAFKKTLIGAG